MIPPPFLQGEPRRHRGHGGNTVLRWDSGLYTPLRLGGESTNQYSFAVIAVDAPDSALHSAADAAGCVVGSPVPSVDSAVYSLVFVVHSVVSRPPHPADSVVDSAVDAADSVVAPPWRAPDSAVGFLPHALGSAVRSRPDAGRCEWRFGSNPDDALPMRGNVAGDTVPYSAKHARAPDKRIHH